MTPMSADAAIRVTLLIVAALPTPELRAGAFLAMLTHRVSLLQSMVRDTANDTSSPMMRGI